MVIQALKRVATRLNRHDPGICRDVKGWCIEKYGRESVPTVLCPGRRIVRSLPRTVDGTIAPEFIADAEFETYERFVAKISRPRIVGEQGFVILPDGQFAFEYITHHEPFIRQAPVYFQRFSTAGRRKQYWPGSYFSILGSFCNTYYHWLHDVLMQFNRTLDYLPADTRIIVPENLSSAQRVTLHALGISESRLAFYRPNDDVTVEQLYFVPPPTITRFDDPEVAQWLRSALCRGMHLNTDRTPSGRRLIVSRSKAACRRVVNETELLDALTPLGFEQILCEELPFEQQAAAFQGAEIVVAPHGAGLANLLFCRAGIKVLEIFPNSLIRTCYWSMAESLGLDYGYICGTSVANEASEPDIRISGDQVRRGVNMMGVQ